MANVRNTTKDAETNPMGMLLEMLPGPGAIERQEARGQRELVQSEVLPADCRPNCRAALEKAGVVFGAPVDGDPLFVHATLPAGWKKQATEHAMHSDLLDEKGRVRAGIFYKAAFYDRRASMNASRRYDVGVDYYTPEAREKRGTETFRACVRDGKEIIFLGEWHTVPYPPPGQWPEGFQTANDLARKDAVAWISERYPDWENPAAYWD